MRKDILLGALCAAGLAAPAMSATAVSQCRSGTGANACSIVFNGTAGNFGNSDINRRSFVDIYTFDIARDGLLNFTLSSSYPGGDLRQDVDFSRVNISGPGGVNLTLSDIAVEPLTLYIANDIAVTAGQYILSLTGTAGSSRGVDASYAGTINFADAAAGAVPEPMTWGLMVLGFGLVGNSLRRRRRVHHAAA